MSRAAAAASAPSLAESGVGLTNGYIYTTLKKRLKLSSTFKDVYAADTLKIAKLSEENNFICVCNLSPSGTAGSHFVCIVGRPSEIVYIDSLALPPDLSPQLYNALVSMNRPIKSLIKQRIQSSNSHFCGYFAIYFACLFDKRRFPKISGLKRFSKTQLSANDDICVDNLKKIIKMNKMA
jgi:hypothetical protein